MTDIAFTPADYTEIRRRCVDLNAKILKKLTSNDIKTCGKHLGVWHQKSLVINDENEMNLFADYAIYGYRPHGFNMAEKYLRLFCKKADDFELAILRRQCSARYAVYQIEESSGADTLKAVDIFSKATYSLVDHQMAKTAYSGLTLAGFLIDYDGFSTQTGGTVLATREIFETDEVARIIDQIADDQVADFLKNPANGSKLAKAVFSATLRLGQSDKIQHPEL